MILAAALMMAQSAAAPATIARGETIFAQTCSVGYCHGAAGTAARGPRLRGRTFPREYLDRVVADGIPNSAMPGWKDRLKPDDMRAVVEYVVSLATATEAAPPANPMPPGVGPATLPNFNGPRLAERGHSAFFDATRDNCGICHAMGGRGNAIGPDLAKIAEKSPRDVVAAVGSVKAQHVLTATLADGETFPALQFAQNGGQIQLFDLTVIPPVLRTFNRAEVTSLRANPSWAHRDVAKIYTAAELGDIAVYLRWAATGK
ncbi:MAG: c-type cytochrome [Candidatus Solibacter usitatus]|nr:c-type cytochrome [Candidatus Solibacter usitatus]